MDWDKLRVFHAVADAGSLTHAGEQLHLSQSAISRQIRGLEEQLVQLVRIVVILSHLMMELLLLNSLSVMV